MEGDTITCMETTIPLDNPFDTVSIASDDFRSESGCAIFVVKNEFFHGVSFLTGAAESTGMYFTGAVH
jgi:hypothetical protein